MPNKQKLRVITIDGKSYKLVEIAKDKRVERREPSLINNPLALQAIQCACNYIGTGADIIFSKTNKNAVVENRRIIWLILSDVFAVSNTSIADHFKKTQSTVSQGIERIRELCEIDEELCIKTNAVKKHVSSH